MAWLIPTPRELVAATRSAVSWSANAAVFSLVLPMRIDQLLTEVELLLARVSQVVASAGRTSEQA